MNRTDTSNKYTFNERNQGEQNFKPGLALITIFSLLFFVMGTFQAKAQSGSLSLDGDADYATAGDSPALDIAGTSITLETWVK
ncbi:MAG TPA: hypothetical protein DEG32_03540, partial [Balneolaceae bacterium]|nr:hypothetical protein [Balneolaceae bacterium]